VNVAEHELLLRAPLGPDDEARDAYERWRGQTDLATLDTSSQRVLALLAERLGDQRVDAVAAKVKRIARFTWLRSQVLLERTAPAVRGLTESGVPVMLIKGAAVLAHTDWRVARRPMDDLDVAIPRALAREATEALMGCGFQPWFVPTRAHLDETHAMTFRDAAGEEIDLHWHVLHGSLHASSDDDFWAAAQPAALRDVPCSVLCREDALFQAVTQGREFSETHPLRWAADAAELLRGAPAFDWERVIEQARRHRLTRELRDALDVLADVTAEPLPRARAVAADRARARQRRALELGAARGPSRRAAAAAARRAVAEGDVGGTHGACRGTRCGAPAGGEPRRRRTPRRRRLSPSAPGARCASSTVIPAPATSAPAGGGRTPTARGAAGARRCSSCRSRRPMTAR